MARGPGDQRFIPVDENVPGQRTFNRYAALVENVDDDVEEMTASEDLSTLTKVQLQERLEKSGLPTSGNKPELIDRILNAQAGV